MYALNGLEVIGYTGEPLHEKKKTEEKATPHRQNTSKQSNLGYDKDTVKYLIYVE